MRAKQAFTTVELITAVVITSIVMIVFIPLVSNFFSAQYGQLLRAKQVNAMHKAVNLLSIDLNRAIEFRRAPNINDTSMPAPAGGWFFTGSSSDIRTLIMTVPTTTRAYQSDDRELVTIADRVEECIRSDAKPHTHDVVYYVHNDNLYRRSLVETPPGKMICEGKIPYQKTSVFPGTGSPEDILVLSNVSKFNVVYYANKDLTGDTSAYDPASTAPSMSAISFSQKGVSVEITTKYEINGKQSEYSITKRGSSEW